MQEPVEEEEEEETPSDLAVAFWLKLEVLMFCANILANIVFLLLRSCSRSRIELAAKEEDKHESEDAVERQQKLVGLFSSCMTPLIATLCISRFEWTEYGEIGMFAGIFLSTGQLVQLI